MTDHAYTVSTPPKTLAEAVNVATVAIRHFYGSDHDYAKYALVLEELGRECHRKRPTGTDGKHDDRHTPECGCGDNPLGRECCYACNGKGFNPLSRSDPRGPTTCLKCEGRGWVDV